MNTPALLPPYPNGWYAACLAGELAPGALTRLRFAGREIILFRTQTGAIGAMDAYCPHLGAHMGYGGTVHGEHVRCPFHGFEYNVQGECTSTPYGGRLPPRANAVTLPARERNGLILLYHDANGQPPHWEIPELNQDGWGRLRSRHWELRGHPQETTENSVDIGHFTEVHGYAGVRQHTELHVDGPYLATHYTMRRADGPLRRPVTSDIEIHVHGLGYSQVSLRVLELDVRARLFVLATPIDGERITLRIALSLDEAAAGNAHPWLKRLPRRLLLPLLSRQLLDGFAHDVQQDFAIWQHKRYVQPPILAEGDGPVGRYRQWAKQFYPAG